MPYFKLDTNVSKEKITPEFLQATAKMVSDTLQKPESRIMVHVNAEQTLIWGTGGANTDPAGFLTLMSVGHLGIDANKRHAKVIFEHVLKHLGIKESRLIIRFVDLTPSAVANDGATFHPARGDY